jgi:hypothetical protein
MSADPRSDDLPVPSFLPGWHRGDPALLPPNAWERHDYNRNAAAESFCHDAILISWLALTFHGKHRPWHETCLSLRRWSERPVGSRVNLRKCRQQAW